MEKEIKNQKKFINNFVRTVFILLITYLIFLIIDASYRIYSQPYTNEKTFSILIIFTCFTFLLFFYFGIKKFNENLKTNLSLFFFSIGIALFGIEIFLEQRQDNRSKLEVLNDLRKEGIMAYPNIHPYSLLKNLNTRNGFLNEGKKIFPLGGISEKLMVQSKENGYWMMYKGDKYGFHNKNVVYDKKIDIVIVGDSYAEGWSVKSEENISSVLQKEGFNVVNIGKSGNGPLLELATLKEYAESFKPKIVLWLYYINDLDNLNNELQSSILRKYIYEENYKQNLIKRQPEIDTVLINYLENLWENKINNKKVERSINNKFIKILRLNEIRKIINFRPKENLYKNQNITQTSILKNILKKSDKMISQWGGEMYFVYLPKKTKNISKFNHYDVKEIGFKYNLTDLNSALGIAQLKKIGKSWLERKKIFQFYKKKLSNLPLEFQDFKTDVSKFKHAYHLCIIRIKKNNIRDQLAIFLQKNNIGFGITYRSVTDMTVFREKYNWNNKTCVNSKNLGDNLISLPIYPGLKKSDQIYICKKLNEFFLKL